MGALQYTTTLIFLPLTASAAYFGGWWSFCVPVVAFVFVPILELFSKGSQKNLTEEEHRDALDSVLYDWVVYIVLPLHCMVLGYFLWRVSSGELGTLGLIGSTLSMGVACGTYGINVAHELGHRKKWHEKLMAKILLLTSHYMHFFIEHNRGHHKRVATPEDPASARYGEVVYAFWVRSIVFSYISAWKIENLRLSRKGIGWFSYRNEMLWYQVIQASALVLVYATLGIEAMFAWLAAGLLGILLLETINYLEHYGLSRKRKDSGRYEKVLPIHSWNANHSIGRVLLFELTRHSDHHAHANRKYQVLRHFDESPQLPTGYPGMMILSLFPPLWFYVMHRQIAKYRERMAKENESTNEPASPLNFVLNQ